MKPNRLLSGLLMLLPLYAFGIPNLSMEVCRFRADSASYIEVSLYIVGSSLICKEEHGSEYGLEYMIFVKDNQDQIIAGNRYKLSRQGCPAEDIMDARRFTVPAGAYSIEVEAFDLFDTLNLVTIRQEIIIEKFTNAGSLSDIQLLSVIQPQKEVSSPMDKSGLYMEPLPFRFYYPALNQLYVYLETYHGDLLEGQPYIQYTLKPEKGDIPSPLLAYKKVRKDPVAANVFQLDISTLISGHYILEVALYDGQKMIQDAGKIEFSRFNPVADSIFMETESLLLESGFVNTIPEDSLDYDLRAMAPIVNSVDIEVMNVLLEKGNTKAMQFFIHKFWTQQAEKMAGPAFYGYMKVARAVDETYRSGFGYGFETDRGHIFLKYGKPDDVITVEDEPSAPPYEIWYYTTFPATHQTNVRFLFYNPSLTRNGYQLLHSTALGELKNDRWEIELYKDATMETPDVTEKVMGDNVHRNARQYFEN